MLIGLLGAEMWSFEVQKFGNFAHLSTFGFFFMNFFGRSDAYGNPDKHFFEKIHFLKVVMALRCPKCILGKFRIFLKIFYFLKSFPPLLKHFLHGFENFLAQNDPKMGIFFTAPPPNFGRATIFWDFFQNRPN